MSRRVYVCARLSVWYFQLPLSRTGLSRAFALCSEHNALLTCRQLLRPPIRRSTSFRSHPLSPLPPNALLHHPLHQIPRHHKVRASPFVPLSILRGLAGLRLLVILVSALGGLSDLPVAEASESRSRSCIERVLLWKCSLKRNNFFIYRFNTRFRDRPFCFCGFLFLWLSVFVVLALFHHSRSRPV